MFSSETIYQQISVATIPKLDLSHVQEILIKVIQQFTQSASCPLQERTRAFGNNNCHHKCTSSLIPRHPPRAWVVRLIAHMHPNPTFWGDGLGRSNWWSISHNNLGISSRDVVGIASQGCVGTKHVTRAV